MDSPQPLAWINDQFVPATLAHVPLHDAGFVWGATITDLCRTIRHQLYRWPDHLERFRQSCRLAGMESGRDDDTMTKIADQLVSNNCQCLAENEDLALVVIATPGSVDYYLGGSATSESSGPTLLMHTFPLPFARYRRYHQEGARLVTPSIRHVPPDCVDRRIKQRSRMHWWLAQQQVQQTEPGAAALLLDENGFVTETPAANFLVVINGNVVAPPEGTVLEGVSMQVIRELCVQLGIAFERRPITVDECLNADEALITSTPFFVAGVSRLNGKTIPWPGSVFQRLLQSWSKAIGLEIVEQIMAPKER